MGEILDFYINHERLKNIANMNIIKFIDEISSFPDRNGIANDSIDHLFNAGYCYYFANMLKTAFGGKVCWPQDRSHIVWVDCDDDCSFEQLQSSIAYDITGIFDDYYRLWPIEYLGGTVASYMHTDKEFSLNAEFKDWCNFYKVTECFAIDIIWGMMPESAILDCYSDGMDYVQTAYKYFTMHIIEFRNIFEYIKRHKDMRLMKHHEGIESYLKIFNA